MWNKVLVQSSDAIDNVISTFTDRPQSYRTKPKKRLNKIWKPKSTINPSKSDKALPVILR